jgi:HTH-type transcriptional regulator/antitoxin HigA
MKIKIIRTDKEYQQYLAWVDEMFDRKIRPGTAEGELLEVVLLLIKQYEDYYYPVPRPDPIDAIKSKMNDLGLKNKHFVGRAGSKGYISAILNKRKPLTLELARFFHNELGIPGDILLS